MCNVSKCRCLPAKNCTSVNIFFYSIFGINLVTLSSVTTQQSLEHRSTDKCECSSFSLPLSLTFTIPKYRCKNRNTVA